MAEQVDTLDNNDLNDIYDYSDIPQIITSSKKVADRIALN
jgi:hypothetical protein